MRVTSSKYAKNSQPFKLRKEEGTDKLMTFKTKFFFLQVINYTN